jgi:predicted DNA binding CopG/RHH family protein
MCVGRREEGEEEKNDKISKFKIFKKLQNFKTEHLSKKNRNLNEIVKKPHLG